VPWTLRLGSFVVFSGAMEAGLTRATRDSVRAFWAERLVVHPERLGDDFIDLCVASQLRNYPSWISLLQSAINVGGLKPNLLLTERWKRLQPPTTLIWGEQDRWVPVEAGERIAGAHSPRIRIVRVPNAGHAPWFDDAPAVARAVEEAVS
jgi:pimeloyl-ACP methyl ester carboxylesterase